MRQWKILTPTSFAGSAAVARPAGASAILRAAALPHPGRNGYRALPVQNWAVGAGGENVAIVWAHGEAGNVGAVTRAAVDVFSLEQVPHLDGTIFEASDKKSTPPRYVKACHGTVGVDITNRRALGCVPAGHLSVCACCQEKGSVPGKEWNSCQFCAGLES